MNLLTGDESAEGKRPAGGLVSFNGLRIVELGTWIAAPTATALFADFGADVVKVEPPAGDPGRHWFKAMGTAEEDLQPTFALDNRRKRAVVLDLADDEDRGRLDGLLGTADVMVTNMRLPTLRKFKLDPEHVLALYPSLVYGSITAFGLRGPDAETAGFDIGAFWARSGLSHQLAGESPLHVPSAYGDHVTGLALFSAIMAGLYERDVTGYGGLVETSLLQAGTWMAASDLSVYSSVGRVHAVAPRNEAPTPLVNSYRTRDGHWFFLTCIETMRHFAAVCAAIGRPDLVTDPRFGDAPSIRRHRRELIALLDGVFGTATLAEWADRFTAHGVLWQKVQVPAEVMDDPQLRANDWLENVDVGDGRVVPMVTTPISVFGSRRATPARAPEPGENNDWLSGLADTPGD